MACDYTFLHRGGGSASSAAAVLALMSMTLAISEIPIGVFSDKYGRARTSQIGAICGLTAIIALSLSWWLGYEVLLASAVLEGLSYAFYSGNNSAIAPAFWTKSFLITVLFWLSIVRILRV